MSETSSENKKVSKNKMAATMIQSEGTFQNTEVRQFGTEWGNGVAAEHGTVQECCWSSAWGSPSSAGLQDGGRAPSWARLQKGINRCLSF